ncbi:MAG: hypothetical protein JWO37_1905 [Acidimicrobiales bacterium]|jgi:uncharacterized membrane protein|nr:hypothetical protein [Acidimicrobiales bacterium]
MTRPMETTRLEAFSDGVFAVAITVLVLNLRDPGSGRGLTSRLLGLWPNYVAYGVSFLVIALLFLNLLLLMTVALIPFPTAVLAAHLRANHESHAAAVAYGLVLTLVGLAFTTLWVHVARNPGLLEPPHDSAYAWSRARRSAAGLCAFGAAALTGLLNVAISLGLIGVVAVYLALDREFPKISRRTR